MKNIAVILAGGSGNRLGGELPKQLLPLADKKTLLEHAVAAFECAKAVDGILIVMHRAYIEQAERMKASNDWKKLLTIIPGGQERWESSLKALQWLTENEPQEVNVLLHDAARPFVSARIIQDVCLALEKYEAVTVAIPATDTMYHICQKDGESVVETIPDRRQMMRAQTPQAFRLSLISRAYAIALHDHSFLATDDCGIVHCYLPEQPIYIVEGEEANKKITFQEDLLYGERIEKTKKI